MREILFRGRKHDTKEFVYGHLVTQDEDVYIFEQSEVDKGIDIGGWLDCCKMTEVDRDSIGQFTGLLDKNGQQVFEGDILAYHLDEYEHETIDGVVKYGSMNCSCCDGVYGWYIEGGDIRALDMRYGFDDDRRLYIVGNIHDNPNLITSLKEETNNESLR